MTLPKHIKKFAGSGKNEKLYTSFVDLFNQYRTEHYGAKNLAYSKVGGKENLPIDFAQKEALVNAEFKREILRIANMPSLDKFPLATMSTNPNLVWATYAVVSALIDAVTPQAIVDSIGLYTEVKNIAWGDTATWDIEARDLFVVSKAGRANRQAQIRKDYKGQVAINPELRQISVGVSLYRVLAGQESLSRFVMKAAESLTAAMSRDAYAAFAAAMDGLPAALTETGFTASGFITLAQKVSAWNRSKAVAVCTSLAAQSILPDDANYRYTLEDEFVSIGQVRNFKGYDLLILPQIAAFETEFDLVIDDTMIWLLSPAAGKMVKLVLEGNTLANTSGHYENADLQSVATLGSSWGTGIATSAIAGIIELP